MGRKTKENVGLLLNKEGNPQTHNIVKTETI